MLLSETFRNRSLPPIIWKSSLYSHSGQEEG